MEFYIYEKKIKIITISILALILIVFVSNKVYDAIQRHMEYKKIDRLLKDIQTDREQWNKTLENAKQQNQKAQQVIDKMKQALEND